MLDSPRIAIKILSGGMAGLMKDFDPPNEVLIGRDPGAEVRLHPQQDSIVGRRHARLLFVNGQWYIEPLHENGVLSRGERVATLTPVRDGVVYQLGPRGPEFRISILGDTVQPTASMPLRDLDAMVNAGSDASGPALRRVEFDPAEVEASIQRQSRRTLRTVLPFVTLLVIGGAGVSFWFLSKRDDGRTSAPAVQQAYTGSVLRAAITVRLKCPHPDVAQSDWTRYWIEHGSSIAVGRKDAWIYALTNHHVFGEVARPVIATERQRSTLARGAILDRWPRDYPALSARLTEFEQRRSDAPADARERVSIEQYTYLETVAAQCEFDPDDADWRQVVLDGAFVPVEVIESIAEADLVLFRFRAPARPVNLPPLRGVTPEEHKGLTGSPVYILGYPGVGDLPLKRLSDAMESPPDVATGVLSNIKRDDLHGGFSIQVTAPINRGNSGGPLFDAWGNVIGVNSWGPSKAEAEGVSYAIGVNRALELLRKHGIELLTPATGQ